MLKGNLRFIPSEWVFKVSEQSGHRRAGVEPRGPGPSQAPPSLGVPDYSRVQLRTQCVWPSATKEEEGLGIEDRGSSEGPRPSSIPDL